MFVPITLLAPILDELLAHGRVAAAPRPWLGIYATEMDGHLVIGGLAPGGPAERAGVKLGDLVLEVGGERVAGLAAMFRRIWSAGAAGSDVTLTLSRRG